MPHVFNAIIEKGENYYIGYCPEVPGANGQGATLEECKESLGEAIKLILQDNSHTLHLQLIV